MIDPIRGADAALWEGRKTAPLCACGTPGYYQILGRTPAEAPRWYCPTCWVHANKPWPTE